MLVYVKYAIKVDHLRLKTDLEKIVMAIAILLASLKKCVKSRYVCCRTEARRYRLTSSAGTKTV